MKEKTLPVSKNSLLEAITLVFKGILVGFGAIMPGISGGTLCVVFGMYRPIIETLSNPINGLKKYWLRLFSFVFGAGVGFVGLSGIAGKLMEMNSTAVTCAFIGFVLGTMPDLWKDAGKEGRGKGSYISAICGFVIMMTVLLSLKSFSSVNMKPDILGFLFCGVMWGLSFVIPGISSSTLLLFFGLYKPMLDGISHLSLYTLIPLGVGMGACLLILPRFVNKAYEKHYSVISHTIFGIVIATMVMILPDLNSFKNALFLNVGCIVGGALLSFILSLICSKLPTPEE